MRDQREAGRKGLDALMHFSHGKPVTFVSSRPQAPGQGRVNSGQFTLSVHQAQQNFTLALN